MSPFSPKSIAMAKLAYATMLQEHHWDFFVTYTTEHKFTLPAARTLMEKYHKVLKKYDGSMFWVAEEYGEKEGFHIHALIAIRKSSKVIAIQGNQYFKNLWNNLVAEQYGDSKAHIDVQQYERTKAAASYVTKRLVSVNVDYDFYD